IAMTVKINYTNQQINKSTYFYPPIVIILRLLLCNFGSCSFSKVSIPPRILSLALTAFSIMGSIGLPALKVVSKSDSVAENKQFFNWPLAVKRNRLQESQNGLVTELIIAKLPLWLLIL